MKCDPQVREPRSQVVFRHTAAALRCSGLTMQVLATAIADRYQEMVAPGERIVEFHVGTTADSIVRAHKANLQLVTRFLAGTVKLPADLEEAWVQALPEPHRADCERELAQRYGFLGARTPEHSGQACALGTAMVSIEFGQLLQHIAGVMADGTVTASDLDNLNRAMKEADDLVAVVTSLKASVVDSVAAIKQASNVVPHKRGANS